MTTEVDVKCECGRDWPCDRLPKSWHTPSGVVVIDEPGDEVTE